MKSLFTLLAAAGLAGAALAQTPTPAPQSGADIQRLAVWYGDWTYAGEYHATPLGEAAKFTGTMSGRPTLNGNVAEFINREKGPAGETQALELCWFDPSTKKFAYVCLGNDGYIEQGPFTMTEDLCTWEGTGVAGGTAVKIKGTETVSPDQRVLTRKTELSVDGKTWLPFFDSKFTKVAASAAATDGGMVMAQGEHPVHRVVYSKTGFGAAITNSVLTPEDVPGHQLTQSFRIDRGQTTDADFVITQELCYIVGDVRPGEARWNGYATYLMQGGDKVFIRWVGDSAPQGPVVGGEPVIESGTIVIIGGTGRYRNIQGRGVYHGYAKGPMVEENILDVSW